MTPELPEEDAEQYVDGLEDMLEAVIQIADNFEELRPDALTLLRELRAAREMSERQAAARGRALGGKLEEFGARVAEACEPMEDLSIGGGPAD